MADIKIIVDSSDVATATNRVDQLGTSGTLAKKGIDKATRGVNQFGAVAKNGGKKMNTFNMQIQQGGYQLQDFVVQLQSGTSFFTAFGQQGSQFAGVFGPQGAVIGAVIAIGAAVGGMAYKMLTAGDDVREFQEILEDTTDILSKLTKATEAAAMSNKELEESFGKASTEIKSTLALLREIAKNEAQRAIDDLADSLIKLYQIGGSGERRSGIAAFFDVNIMMAFTRAGKNAVREARSLTGEFLNAQDALAASKGNLEGQITASQRLVNVAITLSDLDGKRSEEEEALIKKLSQSLLKMQETQTVKKKTLSTYKDILGTEKGLALEVEALNKLFEDRLGTIDDTFNNYEDILGSSKGLLKAEAALNKIFKDKLGTIDDTANLYLDILGSSKGLAQSESALNQLYEDRLGTIDDTANNYEDILGSSEGLIQSELALNQLYEDRLGTIDDTANLYEDILGSSIGLSQAESALNKMFEDRLGTIDDTANNYEDILGSEDGLKQSVDVLNQMYQDRLDKMQAIADRYDDILGSEKGLLAAQEARDALTSVGDSGYAGGRGGDPREFSSRDEFRKQLEDKYKPKKDKKAERDPVAEFQKKLDLEREMYNVTEARQKVLQALGSDFARDNPKRAAEMEAQIAETNELIAVEQRRQALVDSITGSIENGFMAMIDGTTSVKDAFKSMAADIIKELYRVLVVQKMVAAARTYFGFADGGVISGGSEVKAYANGGVVGSPTTFPMAGGKTGLMGEAGPEAIMPLKRGANGKLGVQMEGGGGDVININQSFNFQANGDDSVKKLIAQAAPKIAEMAKSSVVESRRRGGSTKAAFG
mgnify:CR=1 FL=1